MRTPFLVGLAILLFAGPASAQVSVELCIIEGKECETSLSEIQFTDDLPAVGQFQPIRLRFLIGDSAITMGDAGLDSIPVRIGAGRGAIPIEPADSANLEKVFNLSADYGLVLRDASGSEIGPQTRDLVAIGVEYSGNSVDRYARFRGDLSVAICVVREAACEDLPAKLGQRTNLGISAKDQLQIVISDVSGPLTLRQAGFQEVRVRFGESDIPIARRRPSNEDQDTLRVSLEDLEDADHGVDVDVIVALAKPEERYAVVSKSQELYGVFGLWIPYGLFATDGQEDELGITFAPAPVGLGWGIKWYTGEQANSYVGTSAVANWQIIGNTEDETGGIVSGISAGLVVDLFNWGYLGGGVVVENDRRPRYVALLGAGPTFIRFLQMIEREE